MRRATITDHHACNQELMVRGQVMMCWCSGCHMHGLQGLGAPSTAQPGQSLQQVGTAK